MTTTPDPVPGGAPGVSEKLHDLARLLRETHDLGPEAQRALAALADELGDVLGAAAVAPDEARHLGDSAAELIQALRSHHSAGPLAAARDRVEEAAVRVENRIPVLAGFARKLLDALTNLGI